MTPSGMYLPDTSVWARMNRPAVRLRIAPLLERGLLATCGMTNLEAGFSARNGEDHRRVARSRRAMAHLASPDEVWDRAFDVQRQLADKGLHRMVKVQDLVIAATAERHGAIVLHYDVDFDRIASVTAQPAEWVCEPGTAD